jgi:serine/threonine protein kinase
MSLSAGSRLGPYEVLALIGAGGMGEVYKARDTRLERSVAIKVLPQHLSSSPGWRAPRSVRALRDLGSHQEGEYLVMEILEGETRGAVDGRARRRSRD